MNTYQQKTNIQQFYTNQNILITGATGFIGKLLTEKLLRACTDLQNIYIIVRDRKGKSPEQRIRDMFEEPIFEKMRSTVPNYLDKLIILKGDCSLPDLGLSDEDKKLIISKINIIFHNAATVKFDEKIKYACCINMEGTKSLLLLAKQTKNLKAFMHVSTAYSNCINKMIEEKFYEPLRDPQEFLDYVQNTDENELQQLAPTLIQTFPNTYTYTKHLAESIVEKYSDSFPIVVFRPSIVIGTWKEPIPGWVDNLYGPTGLALAIGVGLLRVVTIDENKVADLVPADGVVNALIASAWDKIENDRGQQAKIINYVSGNLNRITWGDYLYWGMCYAFMFPAKSVWYYSVSWTTNTYYYHLLFLLIQLLPAAIVDTFLYITTGKASFLKLYKKIYAANSVLSYFALNDWNFEDRNVRKLWKNLDARDQKLFRFNLAELKWDEYYLKHIKSLRVDVLKEPLSTVPQNRKKMERLKILHYTVKYGITVLFIYFLYTLFY